MTLVSYMNCGGLCQIYVKGKKYTYKGGEANIVLGVVQISPLLFQLALTKTLKGTLFLYFFSVVENKAQGEIHTLSYKLQL